VEHVSQTKITLPRLRADLVARPQLQAALGEALAHHKLVLLSAPAGYGKTVALVRQLSQLPEAHAVAWVSASEDDDLQRLLTCLLEALDPFDLPWRVSPDALPAMALREEQMTTVVDELANALERTEVEHGVLAFDDMHRIADPAVFEFLDRLLVVLPAKWTVVMTGRMDPPLALARMRVREELAEFREAQLRFEHGEVRALLQAAHQQVSTERVEQLLERTQGWVVGLSMEVLAQAHAPHQLSARLQRRMFEYLAQEVLELLPQPMQVFLVRCSVLPELSAQRSAYVSGDSRAAYWLEELERRELFVTVLDGEVLTLKLHDLFREFLEGLLTQEYFEEMPALLRRAAEGEPDLVPRVGYLLRAGAAEEAAGEMLRAALPMIHAGAGEQLIRLIGQFPQLPREQSPELAFVRGLCAWHGFKFNTMYLSMHKAMSGFERSRQWQLAVQARGLASVGLCLTSRVTEAFQLWDAAPSIDMKPATEAVSALLEFMRSAQYGPYASTPAHLLRLVKLIPTVDSDHWTTFFHVHYVYMGRWGLRAPMQVLVDALLDRARDTRPELKLAALKLQAWLVMWRGDVSAARELCAEVAREARWLGDPASVVVPNQFLSAIERHLSGDHAEAQRILQEIADAAERNPERKSRLIYLNILGGFAAASQDWPAARQALKTIQASTERLEWSRTGIQTATLRAELALHSGDAAQALSLLRPLVERAMDADHYGVNARLRVALTRAELQGGTTQAAWAVLHPAVRQAMDAGEPLGLLMCGSAALDELAMARWPDLADVTALAYLRDCAAQARRLRNSACGSIAESSPADSSLSQREMQVLALVGQGQSNKLIARALGLSPHTVKRHMARIFDKTGSSSRGEVAAWYARQSRSGRDAAVAR
jgi:LuxR family maltose regulon positive regulatory protein